MMMDEIQLPSLSHSSWSAQMEYLLIVTEGGANATLNPTKDDPNTWPEEELLIALNLTRNELPKWEKIEWLEISTWTSLKSVKSQKYVWILW